MNKFIASLFFLVAVIFMSGHVNVAKAEEMGPEEGHDQTAEQNVNEADGYGFGWGYPFYGGIGYGGYGGCGGWGYGGWGGCGRRWGYGRRWGCGRGCW